MTFDFTTIDWRVILAALTIIVTLTIAFYFQWWRNRRRFSYEIVSNNLLISNESEIKDKLEIKFAGQLVKSVRLIVIKFVNDGSQPIKKDDFQGRIKVVFHKAKVLSAEKVKSYPDNLGVELSHDSEAVRLSPVLYNCKDYIQFKVLLSDFDSMTIDARIVGISRIGQLNPSFAGNADKLISLYGFLVMCVLLILFVKHGISRISGTLDLVVFVTVLGGFFLLLKLCYASFKKFLY